MKFSEQWLREWVDAPVSSATLCEQLTMAGLEVEGVAPVAGAFSGVVVGAVISVEPHPGADKLRVCEVSIGTQAPLRIVCGASNVAVGLHAPLAPIGAQLPHLGVMEAKSLRGVESQGMLCSAQELGLGGGNEGLMALPSDSVPGSDLRTYLGLDDVTIELSLTPNRSDCLSVAGIAREVGVINTCQVQGPRIELVPATMDEILSLQVDAPAACPRYVGRIIDNITMDRETPLWMQERLRRSGIRSINPVVDVTNYVMLELGQPMHAFDGAKIKEGILVRYAKLGEALTLLDGQTVTLEPKTLVIADQQGALALAGIMGGLESAVGNDTQSLFLESAYFVPQVVGGRARHYGLHSDSSHRFERGVDPELAPRAMERATALLLEIVGGKAGPLIEQMDRGGLPQRGAIVLRAQRIQRVLGADIAPAQISDILQRLEMAVVPGEGEWQVTPPSFRFDVTNEADLIEEIARMVGYNQLPSGRLRTGVTVRGQSESEVSATQHKQVLVDRGYQEVISYSFVAKGLQQRLDPRNLAAALANPLSEELAVMRTSLWPSLIHILQHNLHRQQERVRIFEYGITYSLQDNEIKEEKTLSALVAGNQYPEQWDIPARHSDFFDVKGDIEALLGLTGRPEEFIFAQEEHPALHPGKTAAIKVRDAAVTGWLGVIHPGIAKELGIPQETILFELPAGLLTWAQLPRYGEISRFPAIRRDIAVVVDEGVSVRAVTESIRTSVPSLLQNLQLFDVYKGEGVDSGRKSVALGLTLQASSRTLTDQEVDAVVARVLKKLEEQFGATLRG